MNFTQIKAVNFMGGSFAYPLSPLTLIVGDNRKGKTRIQRACQMVLAGFVPCCGRRNSDIFEDLGNGSPVSVAGDFDTGQSMSRAWHKERNSVVGTNSAKGLDENWEVPSVLITPTEYFEQSGKDRVNYLFSLMDLSAVEFSVEQLIADVKNIKLEPNTKESEEVIREIVDEIVSGDQLRAHSETSLQKWLDELTEALDKKLSEANSAVKRMDGVVKGLIELGAQDATAAAVPQSVEGDLMQARKTLQEAEAALQKLIDSGSDADSKRARKTEIETELGKPHKNGKAAKQAQIEALEKTIAAYQSAEHTKVEQEYRTQSDQVSRLQSELSVNKKQLETIKAESVKVLTQTCCPTCDNKGTTWRKRFEKKQATLSKGIEKRIAELEKQITESTAARDAADKVVNEHVKKRQSANTANLSLPGLRRELSAIEKEDMAIANMRTELAGLGDIPAPISKQAATEARDTAQKSVDDLEEKNRQLIQQRANAASQAQAVEQGKLNIAEQAVTKQALKILLEAKDKLTQQTIAPLLQTANAICQPLLDQPLEYREKQIGWTVPGPAERFQAHTTFCGAEQAIVFAALSIALAVSSPIKIAFVDEMGVIDPKRKAALLALMFKLVKAGTIHQFIGNDVTDRDLPHLSEEVLKDYTVIKL